MVFKKTLFFSFFVLLFACNNGSGYPPVESALDAGRQFIDAIYKGNFKRADQLIVGDEQNQNLLRKKLEDDYHARTSNDRNNLGQSSINIVSVKKLDENLTQINFINNYNGKPAVLEVVKQNGIWLINLKHTFNGI